MSNDATSDVTDGQMVPWAEYQRKQNELDKLCAKASRAVTMYEEEIDRLRAESERLRQAECGHCGRALPPDGDCHGCEVDRLRARVEDAEAKQKIDQAQCDEMTEQAGTMAMEISTLRARVAALEEVVEAARPFAELPILGGSVEGDRLRAALAKLGGDHA